ncbi:MAG: M15 family metallopeptidase [Bacillota bacterium]|nr:M15 family metallopeptidase [Bacillota bacterium]
MRVKKTIWIFFMTMLFATLVLIVNSRIQLSGEVILGGAEDAFVKVDNLKQPLDEFGLYGKNLEGLDYPDIDITDWQYVLINSENPSTTFEPKVKEYKNSGVYFASDAIANLNNLISAAKEAGFTPYINCAYRDYSSQQFAFTSKANQLTWDDTYTYEEAVEITKSIIAYPGTSDHQTGLGIDILDKQYYELDYSKMDKEFFAWMDEHCAEFGFIKRYPGSKKDVTGWDEPWHYRYVGVEAAAFIMENNLTLEEFVAHYR